MLIACVLVWSGMACGASGSDPAAAARALHDATAGEHRTALAHPLEHPQRTQWHYLPGDRTGLALRDMTPTQREHAHALLDSVLSDRGMEAIHGLYAMERALYERARRNHYVDASRDPDQYQFALWGEPGPEPWGWRMEGHHLSLNLTHVGDTTTATPFFLGVGPFEISEGDDAGTCVMRTERNDSLALRASLTPEQAATAVLGDDVPGDVLLTPGHEDRLSAPMGIPLADLDTEQQARALVLFARYAGRLRADLAQAEVQRAVDAGIEHIHFVWMGGASAEEGHYWRLHGPTFILEYDCVGGDPDHVHMVWHDPSRNFGDDPLRRHRQAHHRPAASEQDLPSE